MADTQDEQVISVASARLQQVRFFRISPRSDEAFEVCLLAGGRGRKSSITTALIDEVHERDQPSASAPQSNEDRMRARFALGGALL